jgi:hypothetical protein
MTATLGRRVPGPVGKAAAKVADKLRPSGNGQEE